MVRYANYTSSYYIGEEAYVTKKSTIATGMPLKNIYTSPEVIALKSRTWWTGVFFFKYKSETMQPYTQKVLK